jgi:predicted DNA-binding ribbon-helix-helix protein
MCRIYAGQDPGRYQPATRHLRLNGQSTSLRLEAAFWEILEQIAAGEGLSTPAFISKLHEEVLLLHGEALNFSSILRCTCLVWLQRQAPLAVAAE